MGLESLAGYSRRKGEYISTEILEIMVYFWKLLLVQQNIENLEKLMMEMRPSRQ